MTKNDKPDEVVSHLAILIQQMHGQQDRFGFPLQPSLLEPPEDAAQRRKDVCQLVADCYATAQRHLAPEALKAIWEAAPKARRGRPKGPSKPEQNRELLQLFDIYAARAPDETPSLPRLLAEALYAASPGEHGPSATAIEQRIRRALKARDTARRGHRQKMSE